MAYETGAGSIRTVFGHQYQRLHQNTSFLNWTSGAGFLAALLANFLGGAGGSAANQYISDGKIDPRKSITRGLTNAIEQLPYGTNPLKSAKDAYGRGFKTGAATTAVNYISDHLGLGKTALPGRMGTGLLPAVASEMIIPNRLLRDPKRGCGGASPFTPSLGYSSARGYQYDIPRTGESRSRNKFSLWDFAIETTLGGITGGLSSVAFFGVDKGIKALKESVRPGRNSIVPISEKKADYYVKPNGDIVPSTGYRYMPRDADYIPTMKETMKIPSRIEGTYITFDKENLLKR